VTPSDPPDPSGEKSYEMTEHTGELLLRRYRVGELESADRRAIEAPLAACEICQAKLDRIGEEQVSFEHQISFERFAGGVERATRVPSRPQPKAIWFGSVTGLAAAAALALVAFGPRPLSQDPDGLPAVGGAGRERASFRNTIKGDDLTADLRVAGPDGRQRSLPVNESAALERGARVRIGIRNPAERHVVALSVDEQGEVSLLYPNGNQSLVLPPGHTTTYLPGSLEFLGEGQERVFLLVSARPFPTAAALAAARDALAAAEGKVARMPAPAPAGIALETFTWLLEKPR